jgi:choline dehydrogenase-like flavoprotein
MGGALDQFLDQFDTVIVGAGSAGCVLANRLSADPDIKVCLVEAGGSDNDIWIHIPVGYFYTFDNQRADWRFRTEPDAGLNSRSIKYPRGRVMGGTSSINGMVYICGQSRDDDGRRQQGCVGWAWDDVLRYFKKSEDHARRRRGAWRWRRVARRRFARVMGARDVRAFCMRPYQYSIRAGSPEPNMLPLTSPISFWWRFHG